MNDIVFKMNYVKKNNEINELKKEVKEKDTKIVEYARVCKEIIEETKNEKSDKLDKIVRENNMLKMQNTVAENEREFYKRSLYKIPRILLRIFGVDNKRLKLLEEGDEY